MRCWLYCFGKCFFIILLVRFLVLRYVNLKDLDMRVWVCDWWWCDLAWDICWYVLVFCILWTETRLMFLKQRHPEIGGHCVALILKGTGFCNCLHSRSIIMLVFNLRTANSKWITSLLVTGTKPWELRIFVYVTNLRIVWCTFQEIYGGIYNLLIGISEKLFI